MITAFTTALLAVASVASAREPPPAANPPPGVLGSPPARPAAAPPLARPAARGPSPARDRPKASPSKNAKVAPKAVEPPAACKPPVDEVVAILGEAVAVLAGEPRKRADAGIDAGVEALRTFVAEKGPAVVLARRRAVEIQSTLGPEQRQACEEYGFRELSRALGRFVPQAGFYYDRVAVYRLVGDLFRRP